jgi:hypothetical protein
MRTGRPDGQIGTKMELRRKKDEPKQQSYKA